MKENSAEHIEMRLAYLERASTELSDVVYRQQREIEALRAQLAELASRAQAATGAEPAPSPAEEKPPHY
jgi:uncharacterized coiled-coil protein SlyX